MMPAEITTDLERAAAILGQGGLVAFPTETVYGLGANALDVDAVARVFEAKGRPRFDPLIVHLAEVGDVPRVAAAWPNLAGCLAASFWPGPLTLVLPKREIVPDLVTSGLPTVGVRVPAHPLARELIRRAGCPVAAPSANLFGRVSPTTAEHVAEQLGDRIDLIVDGGPCGVGIESTVLDVTQQPPALLRPGGVTREEIEATIGAVATPSVPDPNQDARVAPGMLAQHYAPRIPLRMIADWDEAPQGAFAAALGFDAVPHSERFASVEVLSPAGDLREAAARFFAALRRLDQSGACVILARRFPDRGLGIALNDRLQRASGDGPNSSTPSDLADQGKTG